MSGASEDRGSTWYVLLLASVASLGALLFGYDTAVIAGAEPFLTLRFGLSPAWEGWAVSCILIGCMIGAALAGTLSDRLGRKRILLLSAVLFAVSGVGAAVPRSLLEFVAARLLGGFSVGMASILVPLYIAEVSPAHLRGRLGSLNQVAIITGMVVVSLVNFLIGGYGEAVDQRRLGELMPAAAPQAAPQTAAQCIHKYGRKIDKQAVDDFLAAAGGTPGAEAIVDFLAGHQIKVTKTTIELAFCHELPWNEDAGWRWMFASGALPAVFFLLALFLVPESPRWLAKQGREEEAVAVLSRVGGRTAAARQMHEIREVLAQEEGTFSELFRPGIRTALVIGAILAVLQQVTGINAVVYYAPKVFAHAEVTATQALLQTVALQVVNLLATLVSICVIDKAGRKPLMLITSAAMGCSLVLLVGAFYLRLPAVWVFVFTLAYMASFGAAMGPVVWVVLSEFFPTRTRGRAMAVATVALWIACFAVSQSVPPMFEYLGRAPTFSIYAVMCAVSFFFVLRFVPETKGKTLEEIERGWLKTVSPRPHSRRWRIRSLLPVGALGVVAVVIAGFVLASMATSAWLRSRPHWQLSVENVPDGAVATVTTTASAEPVFTVWIKGMKIKQPFENLTRLQVDAAGLSDVQTLFFDETVPPGRWTLELGEIKLDIMPARLIVNDKHECVPGESLTIESDEG